MDDTDVDEDKCSLLSLLPSFRQFNDEQKFLAPMEILKIMRHVKLQQNLDTYSFCSLSSFSNAQFPSKLIAFFIQPTKSTTSNFYAEFRNSLPVLVQLLSRASKATNFHNCPPQYHTSPSPVSSSAPLLPGEDGSSDVSSLLSAGSTAHLKRNFFFHLSIQIL